MKMLKNTQINSTLSLQLKEQMVIFNAANSIFFQMVLMMLETHLLLKDYLKQFFGLSADLRSISPVLMLFLKILKNTIPLEVCVILTTISGQQSLKEKLKLLNAL